MARGRTARTPTEMPLAGWLDIGWRIYKRAGSINTGLLAAGIAFYGMLSLFPAMTAGVALAGLVTTTDDLLAASETLTQVLPDQAGEIIVGQLLDVTATAGDTLGLAALLALALAAFSASRAVTNFVIGLNVIYEERETRGFVRLTATNIALTLALIFGFLFAAALLALLPTVAALFGEGGMIERTILLARWPLLLVFGIFGIAFLYRFGPARRPAKWRWLTPGAVVACLLWIGASLAFSAYVTAFDSYNETFGALGGVIVLLTWLWISAMVILFGALVDAELEAQTVTDTTRGPRRPLGERGAHKADTLGPVRGEDPELHDTERDVIVQR
ncbi:MAG: YihY/virulence factor BrkB family protein [Shimia sp.]